MNETGSHPKKTLSALSPKDIEQVNRRLEACLHELSVYAKNREGRIKRPTPGDPGSQYLEEMPNHGIINWVECLPGMYTTSMDVVFHNELVDRIELVRIDPENYAFSVHNDLNMRTIEQWREDLDAVAVINGSYYASSPYGLPITPTVNEGERLDRKKGYESNNGAFFAEPTKPKNPKAKIVSFRTSISADDIIENEGYRTVVFSYPILTDTYGRNRSVDDPQKRATRTFIAQDKQGNIILGNTQGGFFSQRRLGNFLREAYDLDMVTALCMDGGPPACMAVKAGNRSYTNYGQWESVPYNGQEIMAWNDRNSGRWKIPIVIAVKPRN
jgi:hypothetical protein